MTLTIVICANCHQRPGTQQWVGENGMAGRVHGWYQMWCELPLSRSRLDRSTALLLGWMSA